MLQIKSISKRYKTGDFVQQALDKVSLNLRDSEFVAILGPSGSGKTTLLNIMNIFGIVALTTITLFLSAQMSSPVTALITSCVICFLPVVFDFNDSLPVLQKMQEICPIFMLHTNGIFSDMT